MNSMILMQAIGNIDSKYIEEAAPSHRFEALISFDSKHEAFEVKTVKTAETSTKAAAKTNNMRIINILAGVAVFAVAIAGIAVIHIASGDPARGPVQDPVNTGIGISTPDNEPDIMPPSVETSTGTPESTPEPPNISDIIAGDIYYTTVNVNMRAEPSTLSFVVRILGKGTAVEVTEIETNGWVKVSHNDTAGYIMADLLSSSLPDELPDEQEQIAAVVITIALVNVRLEPSYTAEILTRLEAGSVVYVLADESNGWSKVRVGDITGYIKSDLLSAD